MDWALIIILLCQTIVLTIILYKIDRLSMKEDKLDKKLVPIEQSQTLLDTLLSKPKSRVVKRTERVIWEEEQKQKS